jgi:3-phosphoshikimate 1-carboxyvinyltransferase
MSTCHVLPSRHLSGEVRLPSSKSHTMRALVLATLGVGTSKLRYLLQSPDTDRMIEACRHLGARIELLGDECLVSGVGRLPARPKCTIDAGNSGLVLRFIGAISTLSPGTVAINGDRSIQERRSAQPLIDGINQLGGCAFSMRDNGRAPLVLSGPIRPGRVQIDGADSQPVSALLIAASFLDGVTEIAVENEGERPFIDMTLHWLWSCGIDAQRVEEGRYRVRGPAAYNRIEAEIPGDYSAAAFPIAAALVTGSEVALRGLVGEDSQGDRLFFDWVREMGGQVHEERDRVVVSGGSQLRGIDVDINGCIDLLPIMAVLGCYAKGETRLRNGAIARLKESDRIEAIVTELRKMGATIQAEGGEVRISKSQLHGAELESWDDHRIAMALAVAALGAKGESRIAGFECVDKSFPGFVEKMGRLGAAIRW